MIHQDKIHRMLKFLLAKKIYTHDVSYSNFNQLNRPLNSKF